MNNDEVLSIFYKNIEFLQKTIPPDDIYVYAEQTFIAALFFIYRLKECINFEEEMKKDPTLRKYATNILLMLEAKERDIDCRFNLGLEGEDL